jgi:hypothetical protein
MLILLDLELICRRGDTNSIPTESSSLQRFSHNLQILLGFFRLLTFFLYSPHYSLYSLSCSPVIDTKQTPNSSLITGLMPAVWLT